MLSSHTEDRKTDFITAIMLAGTAVVIAALSLWTAYTGERVIDPRVGTSGVATGTRSQQLVASSNFQRGTTTVCSFENDSQLDRMINGPISFSAGTTSPFTATSSPDGGTTGDGIQVRAATSSHGWGIFNTAKVANATNTNYIMDYTIGTTTPGLLSVVGTTTIGVGVNLDGANRFRLIWRKGEYINFVAEGTASSTDGMCSVPYANIGI